MGAGDELMVSGRVRLAQLKDSRKVWIVFEKGRLRWHEVWDHNPRIARHKDGPGDYQVLLARENFLRPYCLQKTNERWTWKEYRPPPGEMYFVQHERAFGQLHAGRVILEPHIKPGASPNKQWGWERWQKLARMLTAKGIRPTQLGPLGTARLDGADFVETPTFRHAAAVLSTAKAAVLHEGGAHHAAVAVGCPAVVIYGGYISPAVTGYDSQVNLFTGEGLGCGSRLPCECCETAMRKIRPADVADKVMELLEPPAIAYG